MIPFLNIDRRTNNFERAGIYNNYLKLASNAELKELISEAQECLSIDGTQESAVIAYSQKGYYQNIFEGFIYKHAETGELRTWTSVKGRIPNNVLNSEFTTHRNVEFKVSDSNLDGCLATGFKRYTKKEKTNLLLSMVGLLIVCYGQSVSEFTYLTSLRKKTLETVFNELEATYQMKIAKLKDSYEILNMGPFFGDNPLEFIKVAFPHGILNRQGIQYQLY